MGYKLVGTAAVALALSVGNVGVATAAPTAAVYLGQNPAATARAARSGCGG
jgi:hypothetical protein